MLLYSWFFKQPVSEEEMNDAFSAVQTSIQLTTTDAKEVGICNAGVVSQRTSPNLTVAVNVTTAYDQLGERILTDGSPCNCAVDHNSVSTMVAGAGNEKYLSIFILFERALSDPRIDGNGATVQYVEAESFEYYVVQSAEAPVGTAVLPSLINPGLLLADIHLIFGQTAIHTADISQARTQYVIVGGAGDNFSLVHGTAVEAILDLLGQLNNLSAAEVSAVARSGSGFSLSAGTVDSQLHALQSALNGAPFGIVTFGGANIGVTPFSTSASAYVDVTGTSGTLTVQTGDQVFLSGSLALSVGSGTSTVLARLAVNAGGPDILVAQVVADVGGASDERSASGIYLVTGSGTLTFKWQVLGLGGSPVVTVGAQSSAYVNAIQFRSF